MSLFVKNNYLTKSLDSCLDSFVPVREHYGMFVSEFIHSKFFVANDGKYNPIILTVDGKRYGFIFTDPDEFEMAFPGPDSRSVRLDVDSLKNMLECLDFDAFILNVSSQNIYLTKHFFKNLKDIPDNHIFDNEPYTPKELESLKESIDNESLEDFIGNHENINDFIGLFELISETRLFGLEVSNLGFEDVYSDEIMAEFPPNSAFQPYCPDDYMTLFTREEKVNDDKSFKFKCLSLVNFSSIVHMAIMDELKGVIINPGDENFIIPVEVLLKNWRLINRTCNDSKIHGSEGNLFLMD